MTAPVWVRAVLPLSFASPGGYDKVQERDRASVRGLADLAPGSRVQVVLHHEDGSEDAVETRHTLNDEHIAWFRAGSALNLLRKAGS